MTKTEDVNLPLDTLNAFEEQVIVVHTATLQRLFILNTDAVALYMFYVMTAKQQSIAQHKYINQIKANRSYCLQGLGWGKDRFHRARNVLLDNNFIEDIRKTDSIGVVKSWYVRIHFLQNTYREQDPSYKPHASNPDSGTAESKKALASNQPQSHTPHIQRVDYPEGGFQPTNTEEHSRNTERYNNTISPIPYSKHTFSSSEQSDYRSQKAHSKLIALTELEIEELALKLNVSPSIVRDKHEQVWESIEAQDKYGKKVKNIKQTVRNWVKWAIDNNRVEQLSPEARLALIYTSPTRDIALYEKLAKVLKEQEEDGK